jgi:tripartite motif-containing protein 71
MRIRLTAGLLAIGLILVLAAPAQGASGTWNRAWGKDVLGGGPTGFEICTAAVSCKVGETTTALGGELNTPWGAATDAAGNVYVADGGNNRIQKFSSSGVFQLTWGTDVVSSGPDDTIAGDFEICVAGEDICQAAAPSTGLGGDLRSPVGVAVDGAGNVYVADADNHRIQKFDTSGHFKLAFGEDVVATGSPDDAGLGFEKCVAGVDVCKRGGEGGQAGSIPYPNGVAVDSSGNVYSADDQNFRVDKFNSAGTFVRAWGKDVDAPGSADDTGTGFEICTPVDVDTGQGGEFPGARAGELADARGIGTDAAANVYVADGDNNRIQKYTSGGSPLRTWGEDVISAGPDNTIGGGPEICVFAVDTCKAGVSGGLGGELNDPFGAATDSAGNVYVADRHNNRIQRFDTSGNFQRAWGEDVAGAGPGNTGIGFEICVAGVDTCKTGTHVAPAQGGELNLPPGVATDSAGALYVADASNNRIQKFADPPAPPPPGGGGGGPSATPPSSTPTAPLTKCKKKKHKRSAENAKKKKCKKKKKKK